MLELIVVFFLARKIGRLAEEKGRSVWGYRFMAAGLWFGGEILGAMVGASIAMDSAAMYGLAIVGAIGGAILSYIIVKNVSPASMAYYDPNYGGYGPPQGGGYPQAPPGAPVGQNQYPQGYPQQGQYARQGYPQQNQYPQSYPQQGQYVPQQPATGAMPDQPSQQPYASVSAVDKLPPVVPVAGPVGQTNLQPHPPAQYQPGPEEPQVRAEVEQQPYSHVQPEPPAFGEQSESTPEGYPSPEEPEQMGNVSPGKIEVNCPHCNNEFWLSAQWGGLFGKCPKCGRTVKIPRQE